uniref:Uncharacterized protein n=1 Tax=Brassica oleracea var. oleracea TaxID=109376 RepID=A0A0D3DE02_BRAOL
MEEFCLESQLKLSTFLLAVPLNTHPQTVLGSSTLPEHILIRNTWKEQSEIDVSSGWTLCPLCLRFVRETVVESSSNIEEFGNAD